MRNMLKKDNILNSRFGKKNHFQVPAGYFDQLTDRVMANLPEQEPRIIHMQPSLWQRMPIRKIAAAVAVLAAMGGGSVLALKYTGSSKPAMSIWSTCAIAGLLLWHMWTIWFRKLL